MLLAQDDNMVEASASQEAVSACRVGWSVAVGHPLTDDLGTNPIGFLTDLLAPGRPRPARGDLAASKLARGLRWT